MKQHGQTKASATRATELSGRKKGEIFAFLWATLALLLFLCLWSYAASDIPYEVSTPNSPAKNFGGITGAYVSWALNFAFGSASYFFVALLVFWALSAWTGARRQGVSLKIFSGIVFFASSCAMLSILAGAETRLQFQRGGVVGFFLADLLRDLFGRAALYIAVTLFFLSVLLATEFLVLPIVLSSFHLLRAAVQRLTAAKTKPQPAKSRVSALGSLQTEPRKAAPSIDRLAAFLPKPAEPKPMEPVIRTVISKKVAVSKESVLENPKPKSFETPLGEYQLPPLSLLREPTGGPAVKNKDEIEHMSRILEETLADFGIDARVVEVEQGPVITRFELQPASGVKLQRIVGLTDNISLAMQATSVRILAPIPGKSRVGIEVPNRLTSLVTLKEILLTRKFQESPSKLTIAIGQDTAGAPVFAKLDALPHLLIAGSTGSGKTVCVNAIITSLLYSASPEDVKFLMIDPKMVELSCYNGLPHLLTPVVTEVEKVPTALGWLVSEMERRYKTLSGEGARNISGYNEKILQKAPNGDGPRPRKMPYIVVLIDELADLMVAAGKEVETAIMRLAQLSRAVGIHLVLATQRPSVDVITGVIKANFPARIAFQVASKVDSRTVLDMNGADALLGKGDLLFLDPALSKPIRAQGAFLSDDEIEKTVQFITKQRKPQFDEEVLKGGNNKKSSSNQDFRDDEHYEEACRIIVSSGQASVSMLQRRLGLGYTRAARLVDMMEEDGIVGPFRGSKPREILIDADTLMQRQKAAQGSPQGEGNPA